MNTVNIKSENSIESINNPNYCGIPFFYDHINAVNSQITPSTVHCNKTFVAQYFKRYLLQKAISVFKWELPEHWADNFFKYTLFTWGFVAVINSPKFGIIPQNCSLKGYDVQYQPTDVIIANPLMPDIKEYKIGVDTVLIRLMPDYGGVMDIVNYYGNQMALCAGAIETNLVNSKLAYVFGAKNKTAAESFKKMFDQINAGNPASFIDKELFNEDGSPAWYFINQNLKETYIASDVISDMRKIEAAFCTKIGIPNANTDKRERLITDEVNANNEETRTLAELWLTTLKKDVEACNKMFSTNISVDLKYKRGEINGNTINTGTVGLGQ